ncbi:MAG: DUF1045 domain-containing protein, partial [Deltaproteobacteria bacterium]
RAGALADFTASWLGWDPVTGQPVERPALDGLPRAVSELTQAPHKYGFHGTLKAPFRLADGVDEAQLRAGCEALAASLAPFVIGEMQVARIGGFIALVPLIESPALAGFAIKIVQGLDQFRAPLNAREIAKRNPDRLSERQRDNLMTWGYPHLMEDFHFHLTLTSSLAAAEAAQVVDVLTPVIVPLVDRPLVIADLCLFGEDDTGRFHLVHRYALTG